MIRVLVTVLLAVLCGTTMAETSLEELIARNTAARGGPEALAAITSLELKLQIDEPGFTAEGLYRVDRKGRMRIDIFIAGERVYTEAYDGKRAWERGQGEAETTSEQAAAALKHGPLLPIHLLGLHEMKEKLRYLGREEVGTGRYEVVELTLDDGFKTRYYLDAESALIVRERSERAFHPNLDSKEKAIETVFEDFRDLAGTRKAFVSRNLDLAKGEVLGTTIILEARVNPLLSDSLFSEP